MTGEWTYRHVCMSPARTGQARGGVEWTGVERRGAGGGYVNDIAAAAVLQLATESRFAKPFKAHEP